jgi:hypothetical protein
MSSFQVVTVGMPATAEEWFRALHAPETEIPPLTEAEHERATRFGVNPDQYARGRMAHRLAEEREKCMGEQFGRLVEQLLKGLGPEYRLTSVARKGWEPKWRLSIYKSQDKVWDLGYSTSDIEAILSVPVQETRIEALRRRLLTELGREDLLKAAS